MVKDFLEDQTPACHAYSMERKSTVISRAVSWLFPGRAPPLLQDSPEHSSCCWSHPAPVPCRKHMSVTSVAFCRCVSLPVHLFTFCLLIFLHKSQFHHNHLLAFGYLILIPFLDSCFLFWRITFLILQTIDYR